MFLESVCRSISFTFFQRVNIEIYVFAFNKFYAQIFRNSSTHYEITKLVRGANLHHASLHHERVRRTFFLFGSFSLFGIRSEIPDGDEIFLIDKGDWSMNESCDGLRRAGVVVSVQQQSVFMFSSFKSEKSPSGWISTKSVWCLWVGRECVLKRSLFA